MLVVRAFALALVIVLAFAAAAPAGPAAAGDGIARAAADGIDRAAGIGIDRAAGIGIDRAAGDGIDRAAADGIDRTAADGIDRTAADGIDRLVGDGIDGAPGDEGDGHTAPEAAAFTAATPGCPRGHIALTFDDGPGVHTTAVLDALATRRAPATFFVVGAQVRARPGLVTRMAAERHVVANHTDGHENLTRLSDAGIRASVASAAASIRAAGARPAPVVRPPYGATDGRVRRVLQEAGYTHLLWSVDSDDWRSPSSDEVVRRVLAGLAPGAVVLLHDGTARAPNTVAALPRIIDTARAWGYCLGILDDAGRVVPRDPPPRQVAPPQQVAEIRGGNRIETAVAVSRAGWPHGAADVVLVTAERHPDALSASALAGSLGGPLLLSAEARLDAAVGEELRRLGARRVILVGPLSEAVGSAVTALGLEVRRIRGVDRYATSALLAEEVGALRGGARTIIVATGRAFPDALAASSLAAGIGHPVLLTRGEGDRDRLAGAAAALGAERVLVVGGRAAVPDSAVDGLPGVERLAGPNRAATAAVVADRAVALGYGRDPLLASGADFPDALVGGVLAGHLRRPLLLTAPAALSPEVHAWLAAHRSGAVTVLGGRAAIGDGPRCQLRTGLDRPDACGG